MHHSPRPLSTLLLLALLTPLLNTGPAGLASAQQLAPGWEPVAGRLVELDDDSPLLSLLPPVPFPAPEGEVLFEAGREFRAVVAEGDVTVHVGKKKLRLKPGRVFKLPGLYPGERAPVKLAFRWVEREGPPAYQAAQAAVFKVGREAFTFLDLDGNGYFDDFEVDGWLPGEPKALDKLEPAALREQLKPCRGFLAVGEQRFLAALRPADRLVLYRVSEGCHEDYLVHMGLLNHWRRQGGVPPVGIDEGLTDACEKHCAYMAQHGIGHEEDPGKAGFTPEGDRAGRAAVVGPGSALSGLRGMFQTFYHRTYYLWPRLLKVGVGAREGRYTCDVLTHGSRGANEPVVYPFDRQAGVDPRASTESPDPRPADLPTLGGTFIVMAFNSGQRAELIGATVRDVERDAEVPFVASTPAEPPPAARQRFPNNDYSFCICPREALRHGATYEVEVRYRLSAGAPEQVRRWRFRTAAR